MTKKNNSSTGMAQRVAPRTPFSGYVQTPDRIRYESQGIVAVTAMVTRKRMRTASSRVRKGCEATARMRAKGRVNLTWLSEVSSCFLCHYFGKLTACGGESGGGCEGASNLHESIVEAHDDGEKVAASYEAYRLNSEKREFEILAHQYSSHQVSYKGTSREGVSRTGEHRRGRGESPSSAFGIKQRPPRIREQRKSTLTLDNNAAILYLKNPPVSVSCLTAQIKL